MLCSMSPNSKLLISACFEAFHSEFNTLHKDELLETDIDLRDFDCPQTLLALPRARYIRHPAVSWTRLFVLQVLLYFATH